MVKPTNTDKEEEAQYEARKATAHLTGGGKLYRDKNDHTHVDIALLLTSGLRGDIEAIKDHNHADRFDALILDGLKMRVDAISEVLIRASKEQDE